MNLSKIRFVRIADQSNKILNGVVPNTIVLEVKVYKKYHIKNLMKNKKCTLCSTCSKRLTKWAFKVHEKRFIRLKELKETFYSDFKFNK